MATQKEPNDQENKQTDSRKARAQNLTEGKNAVLIIDDERQIRETIRDILELESVPVLMAATGTDGIAEFVANQDQVGLVILDLYMPGLSGVDTFAALRALDPSAKIILS